MLGLVKMSTKVPRQYSGNWSDRRPGGGRGDLALCIHQGHVRLTLGHANALKEVDGVLPLVKK